MPAPLLADATTFPGLLFLDDRARLVDTPPEYFGDLNLGQFVATLLAGREGLDLAPYFYTPLHDAEAVTYRQAVVKDLENEDLRRGVARFCEGMQAVRQQLARSRRIYFPVQQQAVFLSASETYMEALRALADTLDDAEPASDALRGLNGFLRAYLDSPRFRELDSDTVAVRERLRRITYRVRLMDAAVTVSLEREEENYTADVEETFARFREGAVNSYWSKLRTIPDMNHVEAEIVRRVARLHPEPFAVLDRFCTDHAEFVDDTLAAFDREVQFYLSYLEHVDRMKAGGLPVCLPEVCADADRVGAVAAYDPVLAEKLLADGGPVVVNDFELGEPERLLVVTGPNHGGKTTFARSVGILHHLAALGLPVPAERAQLQLTDRIFTHFERGENLHDLTGKLEDDLIRIRGILEQATRQTLVIVNEIFNSTSLEDAVTLGTTVVEQLSQCGCLGVCVTFLDELSRVAPATVSMVSTVDPDDPARRTFKVVRRPADGLAYAEAIAHKYGVTYQALKARLAR